MFISIDILIPVALNLCCAGVGSKRFSFVYACIIKLVGSYLYNMWHIQGVKQTDHFGFICRDVLESGPSQYTCYVFQCASESLVSSSIFYTHTLTHTLVIHYLLSGRENNTCPILMV